MMALFLILQQQNQQLQLQMQQQTQQLAASIATKRITAPLVPWPKWDGTNATIPAFLEQLKTLMQDRFFAGVDWTQKAPGFDDDQSTMALVKYSSKPPQVKAELPRFMNRPDFEHDGFDMLAHLLARPQPGSAVHLLCDVFTIGKHEHLQGQDVMEYVSEWLVSNTPSKTFQWFNSSLCLCSLASIPQISLAFVEVSNKQGSNALQCLSSRHRRAHSSRASHPTIIQLHSNCRFFCSSHQHLPTTFQPTNHLLNLPSTKCWCKYHPSVCN
jgi:hypothetical protein